jgi:hypothetical protein
MRENNLFCSKELRVYLENQESKMYEEISLIDANKLLNTSTEDLVQYCYKKYYIEAPQITESEIKVAQSEAKIDVRYDFNRFIEDKRYPVYVDGTIITFYVPYRGNAEIFECQPAKYYSLFPRAEVVEGELIITVPTTEHNEEKTRKAFNQEYELIQKYLVNANEQIDVFNGSLKGKASGRIESRKNKVLSDQGLVASLGFPLKRIEGAPVTYVVPEVARKIEPIFPKASIAPYVPEPTLDPKEYENILSIISGMVHVIERSPNAFKTMGEEELRQMLLVFLNGQYQGQATGETFNYSGKTDILIRHKDKNIFIAECKIWKGPEELIKAIDQLLGYTSWRDTKTAIIIFNRNKNTSLVLEKIPQAVKSHKNFKREVEYKHESGFRYVLGQNGDTNREIILTVLVFDVPSGELK